MIEKLKKGNDKTLHAWAFYDWANSVYPLVVSSAIFPVFYGNLTVTKVDGRVVDDTVKFLGLSFNNDSLISYVTALAFLCVSVFSPVLSGVADYMRNKKTFMKGFCYLGAFACMGLFWFDLDHLIYSLSCYGLALIGFWGSLVFYNSYLPDLAFPDQQDRISAKGFSLGYIGSVILLVLCLVMILMYERFGFSSKEMPTRLSFVLTGLWWLGFSQYTFKHLPEQKRLKKVPRHIFFNGLRELKSIWQQIKQIGRLRQFLYAFFVYSMAVQTIMLIATYFGVEELNWGDRDASTGLITSVLLIQLVAVAGASLTARVSRKLGNINVLIALNLIWIAICVFAYFITEPLEFYIVAGFVGLVMGGIQSLSRSTYSKLLPLNTTDTASFFSFYDVSEKIGIVIGMFSYGLIADITGSIRYSLLFFIVFFCFGIVLLLHIPKNKF